MSEESLQIILLIAIGMPVPMTWMVKLLKKKIREIDERKQYFD